MEIYYNNKQLINNEILKPSETQIKPKVNLFFKSDKYYTLVIYDPDAVGGTYIHWLVTNITNNNINDGKTIIPYKGPAPPPNTGKHRYIFELYQQNSYLNLESMEKRSISIKSLRNLLGLTNYIYKIMFISQNESGGKKKNTKKANKNKTNKNKTNKKTIKFIYHQY
jgi:phosphatidylethanolamine-binding protein (PEBP) family uncharacterized protein